MSFPRYPKYRPSGVEWLGEVPAHWGVVPLKAYLDIQNGADHKSIEADEGYPVLGSGGVFAYASDYLYDGESVLLGRKGTIDRPLHMTGKFWTVDTMYWSRVLPGVSGRFAYYLAVTMPFGYYSTNTALPSMTKGSLSGHLVVRPALSEQSAIASFLDRETAKIDALVAEQQRLIELLKEKRQAVISHAVTKGLNPDAPMKPSGVEWLGEVPAHWEVGPVKRYFASWNNRRVPLSTEERSHRSGAFPYYGASGIIDYVDDFLFAEDLVLVSEDGANLLNRSTPIAFIARGQYWVNNHAHILKPLDGNLSFWAERLESLELTPFVTGSAQPKLTSEALMNLKIAVPSAEEERRAINHLVLRECDSVTALLQHAEGAITFLHERRSALISAAVTGQIDVRHLATAEAA